MERRQFLTKSTLGCVGASTLGAGAVSVVPLFSDRSVDLTSYPLGPVHSYDPVVGDGKWIWREPPATERGYLEPRSFELSIGIELQGLGDRCESMASTPVPMNHPEQTVDEVIIENVGCKAVIRELAPGAGQLMLHAPNIVAGQVVKAIAHYKITLYKQYHGFEKDQFPIQQTVPKSVRALALGDSPGIQTSASVVRKLASEIAYGLDHPWDQAKSFVKWIQDKIRPQYGPYTSVLTAIEKRVGDCEEMSALFVAFCRALGIPARLVWVPNHNWTEFYLTDNEQNGHWIPVHPACYHWFGWTGAHELILQKGDRIRVPEQGSTSRLLMDWIRSSGRRPRTNYIAELIPQPPTSNGDPGPGSRAKDSLTGEWKLTGKHEFDRLARR